MPVDEKAEQLNGLLLIRSSRPTRLVHGVAKPSLCVIAQGSKEVFLGEERFQYDAYSYLLATLELPITGRVLEASEAELLPVNELASQVGMSVSSFHHHFKEVTAMSPLQAEVVGSIQPHYQGNCV